jgi:hypothetical protein
MGLSTAELRNVCLWHGTRNSGHQSRYYGFLGMVLEPPSLKRQEVEAVRRMTPAPFGVTLIPAATDSELLEQQLRMCIELGGEERSLPNTHRC